MPPIGEETSHVAPSPTGSDVIGGENAAPVTDTPSPPETPSPPPPPLIVHLPQENEEPYLRELHPFVPFAPYPGDPSDCLPLNTNLPQVLKQITGKDDLNEVYDLKLRVIAREMSLQRLCCHVPNLRELTLEGSCLISLRDLGLGLVHLEVLNVSRCGLDSLDGLFGLMSLQELHAASNQIDDVSPCTALPNIRHIDLRANNISDISYVSFLSICSQLEHLVLAECPAAKTKGYREEVKRFLPKLITLDGETIHSAGGDDDSDLDTDETEDDDFGGGGLDDWLNGDEPSRGNDSFNDDGNMDELGGGLAGLGMKKNVPAKKAADVVPHGVDATTMVRVTADARRRPMTSAELYRRQHHTLELNRKKGVRCASATGAATSGAHAYSTSYDSEVAPSQLTTGPPLCGPLAASRRRTKQAILPTKKPPVS